MPTFYKQLGDEALMAVIHQFHYLHGVYLNASDDYAANVVLRQWQLFEDEAVARGLISLDEVTA